MTLFKRFTKVQIWYSKTFKLGLGCLFRNIKCFLAKGNCFWNLDLLVKTIEAKENVTYNCSSRIVRFLMFYQMFLSSHGKASIIISRGGCFKLIFIVTNLFQCYLSLSVFGACLCVLFIHTISIIILCVSWKELCFIKFNQHMTSTSE